MATMAGSRPVGRGSNRRRSTSCSHHVDAACPRGCARRLRSAPRRRAGGRLTRDRPVVGRDRRGRPHRRGRGGRLATARGPRSVGGRAHARRAGSRARADEPATRRRTHTAGRDRCFDGPGDRHRRDRDGRARIDPTGTGATGRLRRVDHFDHGGTPPTDDTPATHHLRGSRDHDNRYDDSVGSIDNRGDHDHDRGGPVADRPSHPYQFAVDDHDNNSCAAASGRRSVLGSAGDRRDHRCRRRIEPERRVAHGAS